MASFVKKGGNVILFSTFRSHVWKIRGPLHSFKYYSTDKTLPSVTNSIWQNDTVNTALKSYEDFVGLTEVKEAQDHVLKAEKQFETAQHDRRKQQKQMESVQSRLRSIHTELEKVQRGNEKYLNLVTEEFNIIKEETAYAQQLSLYEDQERENFASLSSAVRESHEKERARAERTKYWSVTASVIGVVMGICGSALNNYFRMRELKNLVKEQSVDKGELKSLLTTVSDTVVDVHNQMQVFVGDLKNLFGQSSSRDTDKKTVPALVNKSSEIEQETKIMLNDIVEQNKNLQSDMNDIRRVIATSKSVDGDGNVVINIGPEIHDKLNETQTNLEYRMKINALWTVTFVYGAFALTLPVLYNIFKGT